MRLKLPPSPRSGDIVINADGLAKSFGEETLFEDLSLTIFRGDRIGVIGPNGVGKTTLVRCLLHELEPDAGGVRHGSRLSVGYYRQLQEHLDMSLAVWQYLQSVIVSLDKESKASEQQARDLAGAFLFSGPEQDKPLGDLSGGERSRAVIAGLVAGAHNLLVLDEPTNHLDIPSAERLEQALADPKHGYDGTLLLITHDRALLESTCTRLFVFEGDGVVKDFDGRYSDWLRRQDQRVAEARESAKARQQQAKANNKPASRPKAASSNHDPAAAGPFAKLKMKDIEQRIESIEARIGEIDQLMLDPDVYTDGERCRSLQDERGGLTADLEPLEEEWARRAEA